MVKKTKKAKPSSIISKVKKPTVKEQLATLAATIREYRRLMLIQEKTMKFLNALNLGLGIGNLMLYIHTGSMLSLVAGIICLTFGFWGM